MKAKNTTKTKSSVEIKAYTQPAAATAPYTNFCRKDTFEEKGGKYYGNWSPSFNLACTYPFTSYIEKGAVLEKPTEVGQCSDSGIAVIKIVSN